MESVAYLIYCPGGPSAEPKTPEMDRIPGFGPNSNAGRGIDGQHFSRNPRMSLLELIARCEREPAIIGAAARFLSQIDDEKEGAKVTSQVLHWVAEHCSASSVQLLRADRGEWVIDEIEGDTEARVSLELLADALDQDAPRQRDEWFAAPLRAESGVARVLAARIASSIDLSTFEALAALVDLVEEAVRGRAGQARKMRRLETILEIAAQWNQNHEMDSLLSQMAEAACRLLHAERASIFLWDKDNHTLVGRPALGVEGGELRIPDDKGVVGAVIRSGESRRVDADVDEDQEVVDRSVDQQLGFQTHTLLCVPMRRSDGTLIGAFELINKIDNNFSCDDEAALIELAGHAAGALNSTQQIEHLSSTRRAIVDEAADQVQMLGKSPAIEALRSTVHRVADTDLHILILGENGTGKEIVSRTIHYHSGRRDEPFIAVNCAALTETLLESELFGHEAGAFTDAREMRQGKFELASGGTLFLDEIGDLSLGGQAKLLRVLEEKVVVRVGGSTTIATDARVVAATNQDLAAMVRTKTFREDLFYRLNVVTLELPPLRERGDDVLLLAEHFLNEFSIKATRKQPLRISAAAKKRLRSHRWQGNIRELRNLMERLAYLSTGDVIDADELAFVMLPADAQPGVVSLDLPLSEATNTFQVDYIEKHIQRTGGNLSEAARNLGMHRSNLYRKMKVLGMDPSEEG